jgi:glutaredoxin 3
MKADIYTKPGCPFCDSAKALMEQLGIEYTEISAPDNLEALMTRIEESGNPRPRTVPQIFLDGEFVGGYDKLKAKFDK